MTIQHPDGADTGDRPLKVTVTRHDDGQVVIGAGGEIDLATAGILGDVLDGEPAPGTVAVVLDLSMVTFCSSTGLSELVKIRTRAADAGVPLRLVLDDAGVLRRTLELIGMLELFTVHPDQTAALEADRD